MKESCKETRRLLSQYVDGELEFSLAARVEAHLKVCPDCRRELAALKALGQMVKEKDKPPKLADEYWDWHRSQVWKRIKTVRRERQDGPHRQGFFWFRLAAVTGGVAVVLIAAVAGWRLLRVNPQKAKAPKVVDNLAAVLVSEQCDKPPEVLRMPVLPCVSIDDTTTVLLRALVETDSSVSEIKVERSSGIELLDSIAVNNIQKAKFRPGIQKGRLVRCWLTVPQKFRSE